MNRRDHYADQELALRTIAAQKRRYRARTGSGTLGRREWTDAEEAQGVLQGIGQHQGNPGTRVQPGAGLQEGCKARPTVCP